MSLSRFVVTLCLLCLAMGCQKPAVPETADKQEGATSPATEAAREVKPPRPATPPAPESARPAPPEMLAGSHILIPYVGAARAAPDITRSKDEALKLATELAGMAKKSPAKLAELAGKHSSCPSKEKGGDLGAWPKGRMVPAFDEALVKMKVGEVSDPVETPFGFHVLRRNEPPPLLAGAHILIAYKGAMRAAPDVSRSKAEALKLAGELAAQVKKDPSRLAALAKEHSACPSRDKGGDLGSWPKGQMVPAFDETIGKLAIGQVSDPVETPFGFHVMVRNEPEAQ